MIADTIFEKRKKIFKYYWPISIIFLTIIFIFIITSLFVKMAPWLFGLNIIAIIAIGLAILLVAINLIFVVYYTIGWNRSIRNKDMTINKKAIDDTIEEFGIENRN